MRYLYYALTVLILGIASITPFMMQKEDVVVVGQLLRVITPNQGGTGIGSTTPAGVGNCLKVSDDSPFTYELGSCGSGGGGATFGKSWELATNQFSVLGLAPTTTVPINVSSTATSTISSLLSNIVSGASGQFGKLFTGQVISTTTSVNTFAGGVLVSASSTIGSGLGDGGLVINGNATTTGGQYIAGNVCIGTENCSGAELTISSAASFRAPISNATIHVIGTNNMPVRAVFDTNNASSNFGSLIQGRRSRGPAASPSAVTGGDVLLQLAGAGYGATDYVSSNGSKGIIAIKGDGTWTDTNSPTRIEFFTVPDASVTNTLQFTIASSGAWGIGGSASQVISDANFGSAEDVFVSNGATTRPKWANQLSLTGTATSTFNGGVSSSRGFDGSSFIKGTLGQFGSIMATSTTATSTFAGGISIGQAYGLEINGYSPLAQITGLDHDTGVGFDGPDILSLHTAGVNRMYVNASGNIGIATTAPYARLSVVGETVATNFTATSTTATSTFQGDVQVGIRATTNSRLRVFGQHHIINSTEQVGLEFDGIDLNGFRTDTNGGFDGYTEGFTIQGLSTGVLTLASAGGDLDVGKTTGTGVHTFNSPTSIYLNSNNGNIVLNEVLPGNIGIATGTPGTRLSIHSVANFTSGTSTMYSQLSLPTIQATSTTASSTFAGGIQAGGINITNGGLRLQGVTNCNGTSVLETDANGVIGCGADATGGGGGDGNSKWATTTANGGAIVPNVASLIGTRATTTPRALLSISGTSTPFAPLLLISTSTLTATGTAFTVDSNGNVIVGNTGSSRSAATLPGNPFSVIGSIDGFLQMNLQNTSNGRNASGDYVVTADLGTNTTYYGNLGINNSNFSDINNYSLMRPFDTYLLSSDSNLILGTMGSSTTKGADIIFATLGYGRVSTSSERMRITTGGRIGIGTSSPGAKLSIAGTSTPFGGMFLISTSTATATSTAFVIDTNGRVGIGTTTPGLHELVVQGAVYARECPKVSEATIVINASECSQTTITLGHDPTITITGGKPGQVIRIILFQDATGNRNVTSWGSDIFWVASSATTAPSMSSRPGQGDIISLARNVGTSSEIWIGSIAKMGY